MAQAFSFGAYNSIDEGLQGTACFSAQLVQDAVSGNIDLNFIGFLPATDALKRLAGVLDEDSDFLSDIRNLLNATADIETAIALNFALARSLAFMISEPQNQAPPGYLHTCQVCKPVAERLGPMIDSLENSVAMALREVRQEVEKQLQGEQVKSLRKSIQSTVGPLEAVKAQMVEQIGFFISQAEHGFQQSMEIVNGDGSLLYPSILGLFLLCLLLFVHGVFSLGVFACCGGRDHDPCCVRYSAGYSLCSSYCYSMLLLLLGGVMVIASTVGSGVCLVMLDFDKEVGEKLLVSLGVASEELDETLDVALTVADRCMSLKVNSTATTNLMDIIELPARDPTQPGQRSTPREDVINLVIVPIEEGFAKLAEALNTQPPTLHDYPAVTEVREMIGQVNMKSLYWSDVPDILNDPIYQLMHPFYYLVSLNCENKRLSEMLPPPLNQFWVPGLKSMALTGFSFARGSLSVSAPGLASDINSASFDCPVEFVGDCGTAAHSSNATLTAMCQAGRSFLVDKKLPLARDPLFVCRYLQLPGAPWGTRCDLTNLSEGNVSEGINVTWSDACVFPNGSIEVFDVDCTLTEFNELIQSFELSLLAGFKVLDATVLSILDLIWVELRALVELHVLNPIQRLLISFDCSFMRSFWSGLTNSLCLRSVAGFHTMSVSYLVAAVLSLNMAIVMYIPWRYSRDNYDTSLDEPPIQEVTVESAPAPAERVRDEAEIQEPHHPGQPDLSSTSHSL